MNKVALSLVGFLVWSPAPWCRAQAQENEPVVVDARHLTIEGQAWPGEGPFYGRLPARMRGKVRPELWREGQYAAGLSVRFRVGGPAIGASWTQASAAAPTHTLTGVARGGMDLYVREGGEWVWIGQATPRSGSEQGQILISGLAGESREYLLYLPLFSEIADLKIWAEKNKANKIPVEELSARDASIVFYGTSITHGASASRPGLTYPAIIGRQLDRPVYNLGFSGQGRMDLAVAALLGELDPAAYVIECTANMKPEQVAERTVPFIKALRQVRPRTPIILVESPPHGKGRWLYGVALQDSLRGAHLQAGLRRLRAEGERALYFVEGDDLAYPDGSGSVDGVHPNDLGMKRIAEQVMAVLARAIAEAAGR